MNNQASYLAKLYSMHQILNENNNNFKNSNKKLKQKFEDFQKQNQIKINNMVNMITLNPLVNNLNISPNNHLQANINSYNLNGDITSSCNSAFSNESGNDNIDNSNEHQKADVLLNSPNKKTFQSKKVKPGFNSKRTLKVNLNDFSPLMINSKLGELNLASPNSGEEVSIIQADESDKNESNFKPVITSTKKTNNTINKIANSPHLYTPSTSSQFFHKSHLNKQFNSVIDGRKLVDKNSKLNTCNKDFQLVSSQITSPNSFIDSTKINNSQAQNPQNSDLNEVQLSSFRLNVPTFIPQASSTRIMTNKSLFTKFTDANITNSNMKQLNQTSIKKIRELLKLDDFRYTLESSFPKKEKELSFIRNEKNVLKLGSTLNENYKLPLVNHKQNNTKIHYDKEVILIRKLNGESRFDYSKHRLSKSKNNRNNISSASSEISQDHEPKSLEGEFPIKIVITDRNRSMAPPGKKNIHIKILKI